MQPNSELISAVLVHSDHRAFAAIVARYEKLVWATAWQILRDYHATQDVTQECFVAAHRHLRELRDPESLGSWLCQIARREAVRFSKQAANNQDMSTIDLAGQVAEKSVPTEQGELIDAIGSLPEHEREVVVLRFLNHNSVAEVADAVGRPVGTVTKQLSRAVSRLREILGRKESRNAVSLPEAR